MSCKAARGARGFPPDDEIEYLGASSKRIHIGNRNLLHTLVPLDRHSASDIERGRVRHGSFEQEAHETDVSARA